MQKLGTVHEPLVALFARLAEIGWAVRDPEATVGRPDTVQSDPRAQAQEQAGQEVDDE